MSGWLRGGRSVFDKPGSFKAVDYKRFLEGGLHYVFKGLLPDSVAGAFNQFIDAMLAIQDATSDIADGDDVADELRTKALKLQVIEALAVMERKLPSTEMSPVFHIMMHFPDCIYRWNSVRNFWCFFNER